MDAGLTSVGWYYFRPADPGTGQVGPVTWEQLSALAASGAIAPGDSVWHPSLAGWTPAGGVAGLFPVAPAPVPPAPAGWTASPPAPAGWTPPRAAVSQPPARRVSHLAWIIPLVTLLLVGTGFGLYFGLRDTDDSRGATGPGTSATFGVSTSDTVSSGATATSTTASSLPGEPDTWLVMMYEDADDEILEQDMLFDLNEAELVGSTDMVTIVAQMDRYEGGYEGDGDVTSTKRYLLTQDDDLYTLGSEELADLGEVDMGDGDSLYDFATWAIGTYPAERYVLILSDHGGGWTGGWSDDDPEYGSELSMQEIDEVLAAVVADTGIGAFELVGFDACLMGQLEVMSVIAPYAKYAVGSEETEPSLGWGYAGFLGELTADPGMTGRDLGQAIVESYIQGDVLITDDQARDDLTGGGWSARSVVEELSLDTTLSAIDLGAMEGLNASVNALALALVDVDQELVARARAYSQSYASVFSADTTPSFIDLGHFADLLVEDVEDPQVRAAAQELKSALSTAVVAEMHGEDRPGSSGLSFYFPNSSEYSYTFDEPEINYPFSVTRFTAASLWDDYLTYHYTGEAFAAGDADVAVLTPEDSEQSEIYFMEAVEESAPADNAEIVGPGAGDFFIAPLDVSATEIGPDGVVRVSTEITGSNIAYVYYYISYYWEDDGSYLTADAGFVEPGYVKEMGGVYYPDWGEEETVYVEYDWEPTLFYMSDGNEENDQFAFFEPTVYGASAEEDIYTVRGTYTFLGSGTEIEAEIDFNGDGDMQGVWGFTAEEYGSGYGTWYQITPAPGDTFTITEEYLEFDEDPEGVFVDYPGGVMTFGDTPFTMVPYYAFSGSYALAIGVEDLDGNVTWEFTEVTVTQ